MYYPEPIPQGFSILWTDGSSTMIHHQRTGMVAMNIFLMVWLSMWTIACLSLLYLFIQQMQGISINNSEPVPLSIVVMFWVGEMAVTCFLIYSMFCEQTFKLTALDLTIETKLWHWRWRRIIPKESIQKVVQVQDGGRGRDSFISWGLQLKGRSPARLIFRQPYEKSEWLGQVIAAWARVEFVPVPQKTKRFDG